MRAVLLAFFLLATAIVPFAPVRASSCPGATQTNDCVASALEWFAKPGAFSNAGATMEATEPASCDGETVHRSVWFTLEVLSPGAADPFMVEMAAPFWSTFGVYTRDAGGSFTSVACAAAWEDEGMQQPVVFAPCTAGTTYYVQVGGRSSGDQGTFEIAERRYRKFDLTLSEICPFKPTLPTEPRLSAPVGGNGEITIGWTEPWWTGGSATSVSSYNVYRADACSGPFSLIGSTSSRSYTDTGLPPTSTRCYEVRAVNVVGEGPAEPGRSATTWSLPRAPLTPAVARGGDGELVLSWTPSPDQAGPAAMVAHRVYASSSEAGPFTHVGSAGASATSFSHGGLEDGETIHYRVSAVNVVGEGPASDAVAGTTWQVPGAPRDVTVEHRLGLSPFEFEVSWSAPADPSPFTEYVVYRASSPTAAPTPAGIVPSSEHSYVDDGRAPLLDYYYSVAARNPAGEGPRSAYSCIVYPFDTALARCA